MTMQIGVARSRLTPPYSESRSSEVAAVRSSRDGVAADSVSERAAVGASIDVGSVIANIAPQRLGYSFKKVSRSPLT